MCSRAQLCTGGCTRLPRLCSRRHRPTAPCLDRLHMSRNRCLLHKCCHPRRYSQLPHCNLHHTSQWRPAHHHKHTFDNQFRLCKLPCMFRVWSGSLQRMSTPFQLRKCGCTRREGSRCRLRRRWSRGRGHPRRFPSIGNWRHLRGRRCKCNLLLCCSLRT